MKPPMAHRLDDDLSGWPTVSRDDVRALVMLLLIGAVLVALCAVDPTVRP